MCSKSSATHCYQCVQQEQRYPLLSVCAIFSCVQTALPIAISVCDIFLCPDSATHCYQCVRYFPVSTETALPIAISVCDIFLCPDSATHCYQCVRYFPVSRQRYPLLSVCAIFSCVQTVAVWPPVFGLLTCAQMLLQTPSIGLRHTSFNHCRI